MKMKYIIITIISIFTLNIYAVTLRNNILCIQNGNIEKYELNNEKSYSITTGQPFAGVSEYVENGNACLNVMAGDSLSTTPRSWAAGGFGGTLDLPWDSRYMLAIPGSFSGTPDELYFIVIGTLEFKLDKDTGYYVCKNIAFGEGINSSTNWWMFNNADPLNVNPTDHSIICTDSTKNKTVKFKYDNGAALDPSYRSIKLKATN